MADDRVSATTVITAPAEAIFAVLADRGAERPVHAWRTRPSPGLRRSLVEYRCPGWSG